MNRKILLGIVFIVLLFVTGCSNISTASGNLTSLSPLTYDWGEINIMGGEVEHMFLFKNESTDDVVLRGAVTSCMCTKAKFILPDGSISPEFSMHSIPGSWSYTIKPGEEVKVEAEFDPLAHGPDALGQISRTVYIATNESNEAIKLSLLGNVISEEEFESKKIEEDKQMGDFVFEETEFDFGVIKQSGGIVKHDFKFKYIGDKKVAITGTPGSCICTSGTISPEALEPGDEGVLSVEFDPNIHEEPEGRFFKTVTVLTDPAREESVEVKIWAEIDLDLGPEAYKLDNHID